VTFESPNTTPGILLIIRYQDPNRFGGIPRKILLAAKWLRDHDVLFPVLLTEQRSSFSDAFAALNLPVHYANMSGHGAIRRTVKAAQDLLPRYGITLVQTHRFWESIVGRWLRKANPNIKHLFRVHTHIQVADISRYKMAAYHRLDRWTARYVDKFCALSEFAREELVSRSHIAEEKISILRNGIPPLGPSCLPEDPNLPIPARFAVVGHILPGKRQDLAVRALGNLKDRGIDAKLSLVGMEYGSYGDEVRALADDLGVRDRVHFAGYTDDVHGAIDGFDVVALPSDSEGIPTCIIEAMTVKKIGIATSVGGTCDLIDDRRNGFTMERGNWKMLADILYELFTTPSGKWDALRKEGFSTWKNRFSLEVMMKGFLREYVELGLIPKDCLDKTA
jgi:glycosyltransferase involved in cell wall biosynthesis